MLSLSSLAGKAVRSLFYFQFVFICLQAYGQHANVSIGDNSFAEPEPNSQSAILLRLMQQVDSISHTSGPGRHFAKIYTSSMGNINVQLQGLDSGAQAFVKKFEISFISYFLQACEEFNNGSIAPESIWYFYFSHPDAEPWQLTMIGVNAHINGDIWKGLVTNFSEAEIRQYKNNLLAFQSSISRAFQPFFEELLEQSPYLRFMDNFTKGMARRYGEWLIYNWRLRQINMAMLYSTNPEKFQKRFAAVKRKKQNIDETILRNRKLPKF